MARAYSLRARLYAVLAFLAVLPLCGVIVTMVNQQRMAKDDNAVAHTAAGIILLERINRLVYAVTMESRGIYMSDDWKKAEPFAVNLTDDLAELERELPAWQREAAALQEANVKELSGRIEQFIRFRGELVRIAKEESPAAARLAGDNEANRQNRVTLNRSLETLALSYEQDLERARDNLETGDRQFILALTGLAVIAGIALCTGFFVVRSQLLRPLLRLRERMLQLASGDFGVKMNMPRSAIEIAEMAQAVEAFRSDLADRQRLNHETGLLAALDEWLQSCNSLNELYDMVGSFLAKLLPGCSGALYIYANSRDVLDGAKGWNGAAPRPTIHPEDCWGLRRGRTYTLGASALDFPCAHVGSEQDPYCCIPILAHGDTIGLLHLKFGGGETNGAATADETVIAAQRRLGVMCAEHISLAIANVKLRDQLRDQSIRDPLTGLFNRRYLLETCRREFARAARTEQSVGVLSIDVDHFKRFNDNHGHDAGDAVLRAVGGVMATIFRSEDVACRFGGEEFVAILPGADPDATMRRAEQLRTAIEALSLRHLDQSLPRITVSIGAAAFPAFGDSPETVMKAADEALYHAKQAGRNRVEPASEAGYPPAATETTPGPSSLEEAADG